MMIIRPEQILSFSQAARSGFLAETRSQMKSLAPKSCQNISDNVLHSAILQGLEKAESYGFTLIGTIRFYIETSFILGVSFDTDPQFPWAGKILQDTSITDEVWRADALHEELENYMCEVLGENRENLKLALLATSRVARQKINWQKELNEQKLTELAEWVYPQKLKALNQDAHHEIYRRSQEAAGERGIRNHYGIVLCYFLNFFCGHKCAVDPLFPWLTEVITHKAKSVDEQVRLVGQTAFTYMNNSISNWETGSCLARGGNQIPLRPSKREKHLRPYAQIITTVPHDNPNPLFEPEKWNDDGLVQTTTNSYVYALNKQVDQSIKVSAVTPPPPSTEAQAQPLPPPLSPVFTSLDKENLIRTILEDGKPDKIIPALRCAEDQNAMLLPPVKDGYYLMALATTSQNSFNAESNTFYLADFHCYRQDSDGGWSHKPGNASVSRLDSDEQTIHNPETAARRKELGTINIPTVGPVPVILDYDIFCGYFYIKK